MSFLKLAPEPHSSALILSPTLPLRLFLSILLSDFRFPIIGSNAHRRLIHFLSDRLSRRFVTQYGQVSSRYAYALGIPARISPAF